MTKCGRESARYLVASRKVEKRVRVEQLIFFCLLTSANKIFLARRLTTGQKECRSDQKNRLSTLLYCNLLQQSNP